jgi:hypothetical protein
MREAWGRKRPKEAFTMGERTKGEGDIPVAYQGINKLK